MKTPASRHTPRYGLALALLLGSFNAMSQNPLTLPSMPPMPPQAPKETEAQKNARQARDAQASADKLEKEQLKKEIAAERQRRLDAEQAARVERAERQRQDKLRADQSIAADQRTQQAAADAARATPTGLAAQRPGQPATLKAKDTFTDSGGGISAPLMVVIPPTGPGGFIMGSPEGEKGDGDEKQHRVTLSQPFALSQKEVTWAQWELCTSAGGCAVEEKNLVNGKPTPTPQWGTGQQPVINVSWNQAMAYTQWLNTKLGIASSDPYRYRLPSEAEWEYAARGGNTGPYGFVDANKKPLDISANLANYGGNYQGGKTREVGSYPANAFGLYDMHGNVWEWVADCYEANDNGDYDKLPDAVKNKGAAHRENDATCPYRVLRGGSWGDYPLNLRAAHRFRITPTYRNSVIGFRLARMLPAGS